MENQNKTNFELIFKDKKGRRIPFFDETGGIGDFNIMFPYIPRIGERMNVSSRFRIPESYPSKPYNSEQVINSFLLQFKDELFKIVDVVYIDYREVILFLEGELEATGEKKYFEEISKRTGITVNSLEETGKVEIWPT